MPSAPDIEIPLTNDPARESSGSCNEGDDIFMTIEPSSFDRNDFLAIEQPRPFGRKESLQKERQISVDPISLKGATVRQASFTLVSPQHPSAKPPPKLKFLSTSLPSSASSSPRSGSTSLLKKIWKSDNEGSPRPANSISCQHLSPDKGVVRRRSQSMSDGRTGSPADDFDLLPDSPPTIQPSPGKRDITGDDGFKCGKLCLFLPRGKGKPVKSSSSGSVSPLPRGTRKSQTQAISRSVSLERFDCGSVTNENGSKQEPENTFFDLPLEMLRCSVSDMQSPVTAAFVFDKDDKSGKEPKGVLKKTPSLLSGGAAGGRNSNSNRHVRFSTSSPTMYPSSPTCITPRLRKARADFNAFLEANT